MCLSCFRENLEKLLEDRHFKEEIVHFNICEEKGVVEASHRARLIPILMRCVAFDHPLAQIAEKSQLLEHYKVIFKVFFFSTGSFYPAGVALRSLWRDLLVLF